MPLESLSDEQINIHDLTLEQEKKPQPDWQKEYQKLKRLSFFDGSVNLWNESDIDDSCVKVADQMVDVLIKTKLDKEEAFEERHRLEKPPFYDLETGAWHSDVSKDSTDFEAHSNTVDLYYDLAFCWLYPNTAIDKYTVATESYYSEQARRYSDFALLRVSIISTFNPRLAAEEFDKILNSNLYDSRGYFRVQKEESKVFLKSETAVQLLGVLAQSNIDRQKARERFEMLKKSPLYDQQAKLWNKSCVLEDNKVDNTHLSINQLLEILCLSEFEESTTDLKSPIPQLPEVRSY